MLMPSIFGENLIDDFFEDFARPMRRAMNYGSPASGIMKTDVRETEGCYELDIDLPGYRKEDVKAELNEGYLTISASTESDNDEKDSEGRYIRRERYSGTCSRSFYVGEDLTQEEIKAKFEDGILKLFVPKKDEKKAVAEKKYIAIEG
ncbi:MAG: Hsp20/alpha crystallin family protein [Lachnospiraceae bacterium]|nr:Hsp20/alpha crystallin family protein [Lachnospiraceae bacterium]